MKVLSCYKVLAKDDQTNGGIGQGGGFYWTDTYGLALQKAIADELGAEFIPYARLHGRDSFSGGDYDLPAEKVDIAYCQPFECPKRRPADFVWTAISDYIGAYEHHLERFLEVVKPDLVVSLQYPLVPPLQLPQLPQLGALPNLVNQCALHGCKVIYLPWVNAVNIESYNAEKQYAGMCTGKMSGTYPFRDASWKFLSRLAETRDDIVVSGNPTGSTFSLGDEDYRRCLGLSKYYFTGGIYDLQIPPKVYEVMNYGACLVCHDMPMMEASGLIPGETYLPIESVEEIPAILERDDWKEIAPKGQAMVHERHSLQARARDFVRVYREITGNE